MQCRTRRFAAVLVAGVLAGCASSPGAVTTYEAGGTVADTAAALDLRLAMRKLWSEHVVWTRDYIVAALADHPSATPLSARLLRNQQDIGNAIKPYYGASAGDRLSSLLQDHIRIAVDLVAAAKANDAAKKTDADKRWHANAAEIATFLAGANPNWPRQTLLDMLNEHLSLTTQEVLARLESRWTDDVAMFDRIHEQALMMADALIAGIVKQFPARF
jgi:hypothetical protein